MNQLKHMAEFRAVLASYKPSVAAKEILKDIKLVLLTAPTAGGRNTIIDKLVTAGGYHFLISDTTREKRVNSGVLEQNGKEYWFRSEDEMLEDLKHGAFLEAELIHEQQVSGISIRELERAMALHKIAIDEVDMQGIANVLPVKPDTVGILVIPPSFEEWQKRLSARGVMEPRERRRRFESAAEIYAMAANGTYPVIINDVLDEAVRKVDRLARFGELDENQEEAQALGSELMHATRKYLQSIA